MVSEDCRKRDRRVLQKIYEIWYTFWILATSLVWLDFFKWSNFLSFDSVFHKTKIIYFWFQTKKNDWVWRKFFERYITILSVSVSIIGVSFSQLVSLFETVDSMFESFLTDLLKILNTLIRWRTCLFIITLWNVPIDFWHNSKVSNNVDV